MGFKVVNLKLDFEIAIIEITDVSFGYKAKLMFYKL